MALRGEARAVVSHVGPIEPADFASYLAERGWDVERWRELYAADDASAQKIRREWLDAYDDWLQETGRVPGFPEDARAQLGVTPEQWREMKPLERMSTIERWLELDANR